MNRYDGSTWWRHSNVLMPQECNELVNSVYAFEWEHSSVFGIDGKPPPDTRVSQTIFLHNRRKYKWLYDKMWDLLHLANREFFGFDIQDVQDFQLTKYENHDQGHYDWHPDCLYPHHAGMQRKLSAVIPLSHSSQYQGGGFSFRDTGSPEPEHMEMGNAIVFPSYYVHKVAPVVAGVRYSLVAWFVGPAFR